MLANFHSVGSKPSLSKFHRVKGQYRELFFLSIPAGISSGPGALFTSRLDKTARTLLAVNVKSHSSGLARTL